MTDAKTSVHKNYSFISLLISLPCWWLAVKGYQAAMLTSKNPDILELYSYMKLIGLIGIFIICLICSKFIYPKTFALIQALFEKLNFTLPSPNVIFLLLYILASSFTMFKGAVVGEDISDQVLSTLNFIEGKVDTPNLLLKPSTDDLSKNSTNWHIRPPGASWLTIPAMLLGFPLGHAIKLSLFTIGLFGGIGWLKLSLKLGIKSQGLYYLSVLLAFSIGLQIQHFGTMNSALFAIVPWMLLWAIHISALNIHNKRDFLKSGVLTAIFYLLLGCFCLLKMSGLIVALTIAFVFLLLVYLKKPALTKNHFLLFCVLLSPLILFSPKVLNSFNNDNLGFDSHTLYTTPDYNKQSLLWGENFVESTEGKMLMLSALGSPGYALSLKSLMHSARDFCLQFESFTIWSTSNKINPHVFICGIFGIITLIFLILLIKKNKKDFSNLSLTIFSIFYIIPFLGLAILSNLHGFNYSLYATHTIEYSLLLLLPLIIVWEHSQKNRLVYKGFINLSLVMPLLNIINMLPHDSVRVPIAKTEIERGFSSSRFSEAIEYIESDSENDPDIIYFLPSGDMGDLVLRSKMRNMATHFAGDNFPKIKTLKTSEELNVYLAYDEKLAKNPKFSEAIINKFPDSILEEPILKGNIFVQKIKLLPTLSVF